jgi:hypothetical protein
VKLLSHPSGHSDLPAMQVTMGPADRASLGVSAAYHVAAREETRRARDYDSEAAGCV